MSEYFSILWHSFIECTCRRPDEILAKFFVYCATLFYLRVGTMYLIILLAFILINLCFCP